MKKRILALIMVAMIAVLTACGSGSDATPTPEKSTENKYSYVHNGQKITIGESAEAVLKKLGEATSTFTSISCAFEGEDHFYTYGTSLQIVTSQVNGKEILTTIQLLDDLVATPQGIRIGDSEEAVAKAYGEGKDGKFSMKDGKTSLVIVIKNGEVSSITYTYAN